MHERINRLGRAGVSKAEHAGTVIGRAAKRAMREIRETGVPTDLADVIDIYCRLRNKFFGKEKLTRQEFGDFSITKQLMDDTFGLEAEEVAREYMSKEACSIRESSKNTPVAVK